MIRRYKIWFFTAFVLVILFIFSRLVSLVKLPIFVDEAIYLRWAQIAKNDASWRFISLTDGKQPLFVWLTMTAMYFIKDPIVAGRLISVLAGLASMLIIWGLGFIFFKSKRLACFASLLYLIFPFALVYDRMALMEALVGVFSLLSLLLAFLLAKTLRLDVALLLGAALGGGVLTKTSGFLSIYFLPLTLFVFDWRSKKWKANLLKWAGLALLAVVISQLLYSVLRLSPLFYMIGRKDTIFVFPLKEWLKDPFYYLLGNLRGLGEWLIRYLTWPWLVLVTFSLVLIKKKTWEKSLLFFWFLAPFAALAVFGRVLYPRFIFFMSLPLLLLVAWSLEEIRRKVRKKWIFVLFCLPVFAWPLLIDFQLLLKPESAFIPKQDKEQYITSWPVGHGIAEMIDFLKIQAQDKKIFLATEGTFGLMPASFELYLWNHPNIEIKGFFPVNEVPLVVLEKAEKMPTFFVFNETQNIPGSWPLKLVAEYPRPDPRYSMRLYQVK